MPHKKGGSAIAYRYAAFMGFIPRADRVDVQASSPSMTAAPAPAAKTKTNEIVHKNTHIRYMFFRFSFKTSGESSAVVEMRG